MSRRTRIILTFLALTAMFIWAEVAKSPPDNALRLYFLDVGQGDSALIQKGNYQVLIDGGPDDNVLSELGRVMPLSDRRIEIMILTHPHADHLVGLNSIMNRYEIDQIYVGGVIHTSNAYLEFLETIKNKQIPLAVPEINQIKNLFEGAVLTFLWPGKVDAEQSVENLNNTSIVNRFCYFDQCALLTGDIETEEQERMFSYYTDRGMPIKDKFSAVVLKAPHHGSANANTDSLYEKIIPRYVVISAGADNRYGHPHRATLDTIEKIGAQILRTDRDGAIEFIVGAEGVLPVQ
ncbi:MAG: MBL fold metallo-hydrolase [Patescibacteria group bacterium]